MSDQERGKFRLFIKNRGLFEDIFLYFILVCVLGFSGWFLLNTQQRIENTLPKTSNVSIFLDAAVSNKSDQTNNSVSNSSADVKSANSPAQNKKTDSLSSKDFDKNYLAYLQAQTDLNRNRYDLGNKALITNTTRKNISFLIGMLLALVGCIVVVRRIRNMDISAQGSAVGNQIKFATGSPGVMLILMGSVIIIATIIRTDSVNVKDHEPVPPFQIVNYKGTSDDSDDDVSGELDKAEQASKKASSQKNSTDEEK